MSSGCHGWYGDAATACPIPQLGRMNGDDHLSYVLPFPDTARRNQSYESWHSSGAWPQQIRKPNKILKRFYHSF